jgi:deoxyribose-phosphate aldolase
MMSSTQAAALALRCLDLTELGDTCGPQEVGRLLAAAETPHGPVAAVCVWPQYVSRAAHTLRATPIRVATVINFPAGGDDIERAVEDTREALRDGADEIDLVIPYRALMAGNEQLVADMIAAVADCLPTGRHLKAILETGELSQPDLITRAAEIAIGAGAHFLKTSTGKTPVSATPEAATLLLATIQRHGGSVGLKVSGGIRNLDDARGYLELAVTTMGEAWVTPEHFRIGASSLLTALLAELGDEDG